MVLDTEEEVRVVLLLLAHRPIFHFCLNLLGLIQLTGRTNYKKVGGILGQNYEGNPTLVEAFPHALEVSGVYWDTRVSQY